MTNTTCHCWQSHYIFFLDFVVGVNLVIQRSTTHVSYCIVNILEAVNCLTNTHIHQQLFVILVDILTNMYIQEPKRQYSLFLKSYTHYIQTSRFRFEQRNIWCWCWSNNWSISSFSTYIQNQFFFNFHIFLFSFLFVHCILRFKCNICYFKPCK